MDRGQKEGGGYVREKVGFGDSDLERKIGEGEVN